MARDPVSEADQRSGTLYVVSSAQGYFSRRHESESRGQIARRLADILGYAFGGDHGVGERPPGRAYFVPSDTLLADEAKRLGIGGEADLFGGVVPHRFVATKAISHVLPPGASVAPEGWSLDMAEAVGDAVLPGFTAFTLDDALAAGRRLLERGELRIKAPEGVGGHRQSVVSDEPELAAMVERLDADELAATGIVLEENVPAATSCSVGQVRVKGMVASYYGLQRQTSDNRGEDSYGGSSLMVVKGGFEALLRLDLPGSVRTAIAQARRYDEAASRCYPGFFASRRNYDVAQGRDASGRMRSGVLEQSWRIGGASGAEVAALEAFRAHPGLACVKAGTVEIFGESPPPPEDALVLFRGVDEVEGPITKYVTVDAA